MKKTPEEIFTILYELSEDANQWPCESAERRRVNGVHPVDANTSVQVQLDAMAKEIKKLTLASIQSETHATCDICGRGHPTHECQALTEEVNAVGNYNFNAMELRNLEKKVGQIATILSERIPGTLPSDTERNPKENVNALKNEVDKKKTGKKGADKKKEDTSRRKLESEIGEIRSVPISLQLANQTTLIPEGIVVDVLVRVDKFVFPVDFIVINMEENKEVSLILGRPFLATDRAILDIHARKRMLRVGEETVNFEMNVETWVKKGEASCKC
ncbi:uncharacterized protein [Nicotiana tomentosiformis]|uniref:uncharacterized protein n=1 Tax=Nicotiana tomentosiformis TaxID=4098 RepID=UPI00388C71B1